MDDQHQRDQLGARLRRIRIQQGLTQKTVAQASQIAIGTLHSWERGHSAPRPWRCPTIAAALGVPVAQLFTDASVLIEITLSEETKARVRDEGREASEAAAGRLAAQLEPLIYQEATRQPIDLRPGTRAKRRRTRAEKLAGIKAAKAGARRRGVSQSPAFTVPDQ